MNIINSVNNFFRSSAETTYSPLRGIRAKVQNLFTNKPAVIVSSAPISAPLIVTPPSPIPFEPTDRQIDQSLSSQNFKKFAERVSSLNSASQGYQKINLEKQELIALAGRINLFLANIPTVAELRGKRTLTPPALPEAKKGFFSSLTSRVSQLFGAKPPVATPLAEPAKPPTPKEKMLKQLQQMSQDLGISLLEARDKSNDEALQLLLATNQKIGLLSGAEKIKKADLKQSERDIRTFVESTAESPIQKSNYDNVLSFHAGGNLLKGEGNFLFAEAPPKFHAQLSKEKIQELLQGKDATYVDFKNGRLVPVQKGPILLYKIPVAAAMKNGEEVDFAQVQRSGVLVKSGKLEVVLSKDPKQTKHIAPYQSAAIERAQSILIMRAFMKDLLTGKSANLDFNAYAHIVSYLDALAANDLCKNGYGNDSIYKTYKSIFENFIREPFKQAVIAQKVHSATQEILAEKEYKWSDDMNRISLLKEMHNAILVNFYASAGEFIQEAKKDPFSERRLSWFIEEFEKLQKSAKTLLEKMGKDLPVLRGKEADLRNPEMRASLRKQLSQFDENSAVALRNFLEQLHQFHQDSINLAVASASPMIADKIHRYMAQLSRFELLGNHLLPCIYGTAAERRARIAEVATKLTNGAMKTLQDPPRVGLLTKDFFKGTPFNRSLISVLDSFKLQMKSSLEKEATRLQRTYKLQGMLDHQDKAKAFFFPKR